MNKTQALGLIVGIWFLFLILNMIAIFTDDNSQQNDGEKILATLIHTTQVHVFRSSSYKFMNLAFNNTFGVINQLLHESIMGCILFYVIVKGLVKV